MKLFEKRQDHWDGGLEDIFFTTPRSKFSYNGIRSKLVTRFSAKGN